MNRRNEFLSFAVNASSDTKNESENDENMDEDERSLKSALKDWVIIKAKEANIRLNNDFTPLLSPTSYRRKSHRASSEQESAWNSHPNDAYSLANRTFELTSFDHILREYKNSRVLAIDDINQSSQSSSFMKIFKSPEPAKKMSISQVTATNMGQKADGAQVKMSAGNGVNCCVCHELFSDRNTLEMHIAKKHVFYSAYKCEHCKTALFPTDYALRQHYQVDHRQTSFVIKYNVTPNLEKKRILLEKLMNSSLIQPQSPGNHVTSPSQSSTEPMFQDRTTTNDSCSSQIGPLPSYSALLKFNDLGETLNGTNDHSLVSGEMSQQPHCSQASGSYVSKALNNPNEPIIPANIFNVPSPSKDEFAADIKEEDGILDKLLCGSEARTQLVSAKGKEESDGSTQSDLQRARTLFKSALKKTSNDVATIDYKCIFCGSYFNGLYFLDQHKQICTSRTKQ